MVFHVGVIVMLFTCFITLEARTNNEKCLLMAPTAFIEVLLPDSAAFFNKTC